MREYKILVISDTHIFYKNSRVRNGFSPETIAEFAKYDHVVMAGDTFDFHYCFHKIMNQFKKDHPELDALVDVNGEEKLHPELKRALRQAITDAKEILRHTATEMAKINPNAKLLNLMGNHDNVTRFGKVMDELKDEMQGLFNWHEEYFLFGDTLVTHGDTVIRKQNLGTRETIKPRNLIESFLEHKIEDWFHNWVQMSWFLLWNHRNILLPRFDESLEKHASFQDLLGKIRHCIFGHFHVTPHGAEGVVDRLYYQAGASIKHRNCKPLCVTIRSDEPPHFTGDEKNILFPDAKADRIDQVEVPGLSHKFTWKEFLFLRSWRNCHQPIQQAA